jgi:hypothetical protein
MVKTSKKSKNHGFWQFLVKIFPEICNSHGFPNRGATNRDAPRPNREATELPRRFVQRWATSQPVTMVPWFIRKSDPMNSRDFQHLSTCFNPRWCRIVLYA